LAQIALFEIPKMLHDALLISPTFSKKKKKSHTTNVTGLLSETFHTIQHDRLPRNVEKSGAVAASILRYKQKLNVSHVGDSHAIVVRCDNPKDDETLVKATVLYESKPHKPMDPTERERIIKAGGKPYF
jgi:serine/threonine protein phosphatase PrpC